MRTIRWTAGSVLLVAMLVTTVEARGEDDAIPQDPKADDVKLLATAAEVAEFGRTHKSPEALITAAGMLLKANALTQGKMGTLDAECVDEAGKKVVSKETDVSLEKQAESLFTSAAAMAASKGVNVKPMIDAAKTRKYTDTDEFKERAVVGGPKRISRKVVGGGAHHYTIQFVTGAPASIALQSDQPVRFIVRDPGVGPLVNGVVKHGHYNWVPKGKGKGSRAIKVEVHGMGKMANYTVYAN